MKTKIIHKKIKHNVRSIILLLFCSGYYANCSAQLIIADSLQIAKFYNGSIADNYIVKDTVNGREIIHYVVLYTPYDRHGEITKIEKIKPKMVIGTWVFDTIMPRKTIHPYKLVFDKKYNYLQYDSVSVWDTISGKDVRVERILKGKWKIDNDTLYRSITSCVTGCNSSWEIHTGGWSGDVFYNSKIYLTEGIAVLSARRYRRKD